MKVLTQNRLMPRTLFWIPILVCVLINSAIFVGIAIGNQKYFVNYRLNPNPDAVHYVLIGRNAFLHGEYSRSESPPYVPDMLRTPMYPLFSGGFEIVGKPVAIYAAQVLLQLASCAVLFRFAERFFGKWTAFAASLFLATDTMWAISNFEALSEPLFVFLVLYAAERLANGAFSETRVKYRLALITQAGLLLGLATLTRPVALYSLIYFVPIAFLSGRQAFPSTMRLFGVAILMAASLCMPAAWIGRNYVTFSVPRLTNVDLNNLVYFVGAGAYQIERGLELRPAQQVISQEFGLLPYTVVQNGHSTKIPMPDLVANMRDAWPEVVFKYPGSLCVASALAIVKSFSSHNTGKLAEISGRSWVAPQTADLIRLRGVALERIWSNGPALSTVFFWQMAHTLLTCGLTVVGIVVVLKSPTLRPVGGYCLFCLLYYVVTIPLFGLDAYYRCRFPALPFLYVFAGLGAVSSAAVCLRGVLSQHSEMTA
jgi:4-amino-4-deoxy-L-arabinose transferase-like glycosyltransferase